MKLRTDDNVIVIRGRDRGKLGRVVQTLPKSNRVLVEGVNMVTKHMKPTQGVRQGGGIIKKEMPMRTSSVMLVCASCNKPSRIGYTRLADGAKARFCKACEEVIE